MKKEKFYFNIKIKDKAQEIKIPSRANEYDAGLDVYSTEHYFLGPNERGLFTLGFMGEFPHNWVCEVRSKSGRALKEGLIVLNQPGTIDSTYRGEYGVILFNSSNEGIQIEKHEKIAQLVFVKCKTDFEINVVDELNTSDRNEGGYGSSGL